MSLYTTKWFIKTNVTKSYLQQNSLADYEKLILGTVEQKWQQKYDDSV